MDNAQPIIYDKTGRQILQFDILKVFHFIGARKKRHYMYKQAQGIEWLGEPKTPHLIISHLDQCDGSYTEVMNCRILEDVEIVQGYDGDGVPFYDRRKLPLD